MKIKKILLLFLVLISITFLSPALSYAEESDSNADSGTTDKDWGFHLRGSLGAGKIFWGYISHASGSGDLGTGAGGIINLAALFNYSAFGLELNILSGNIDELEWTDTNSSNVTSNYNSTGTGNYTVTDFKAGAKLFTEPGDMGYTYFYGGLRFWSSERSEESRSVNGVTQPSQQQTRKAKGNGWILGYRDFSTFGWDDGLAIVFQTGFYFGKSPVKKMSTDGADQTLPVKSSFNIGGEVGAGVAFQNIGLSVIGGMRGDINATSFKDPAAPVGEESIFGFGGYMFFIEAGYAF